jgi:hypothetical protein
MKIDGGCHCGNITYEAEVDPEKAAICHCTDCQSLSGTAFRTVVISLVDAFTLLSGEPKMYAKIGGSGAKRIQAFCPDCGSQIYATSVGDGPKIYGIRLGTVRQRDELPPKRQIWHRSAQKWLADLGAIPTID